MVLANPNEEETNVQNVLARQVRELNRRVQHLETLERLGDSAYVLDIDLTDITVTNTTDETTFYSFTIPGNILNDADGIRLLLFGQIQQNDGAVRNLTIRMKYGATTVVSRTQTINTAGAALTEWTLDALLLADGATNIQEGSMFGHFRNGRDIETLTSGIGSAAEDSTGDLTLEFTIEWGVASNNLDFVYREAIVEVLPIR